MWPPRKNSIREPGMPVCIRSARPAGMDSADGNAESGIAASRGGLPRYDDLPQAANGGRSGWGLFGPEPGLEDLDDVYDNFYPQASSQWDSFTSFC